MARGKAKNHARKVGMGEVGDTVEMGRGGNQGVSNDLLLVAMECNVERINMCFLQQITGK